MCVCTCVYLRYWFSFQMENIGKFLDACVAYGVPKSDLFQTVDLFEGQNIPQVYTCEGGGYVCVPVSVCVCERV